MMKKVVIHLRKFVPYFLYSTIIGVLFFPAFFAPPDQYLFGWDLMDISYPMLQFFHNNIGHGVIPLWDPYIMAGHPYIGIAASMTYPLFWVFALFPVPLALVLYYGVHILIAMVGMYRLCLRFTSRLPAFFAGTVYGLTGFFFPRILTGVPDHVAAAAFLPYIVIGVFHIIESDSLKKSIPGIIETGLFWGLMVLIGDQRLGAMGAGLCGVVTVLYSLKKKSIVPIVGLVLAMFVGVGIAFAQILPLWEYFGQSIRSTGLSYELASQGFLPFSQLGQLIYPLTRVFIPNTAGYPPFPEGPFYAGMLPLILAIAGFILFIVNVFKNRLRVTKRNFVFFVFTLIGAVSLWAAMGSDAPFVDIYKFIWKYIPMYKAIRVPHRFVLVFIFSIALLSAMTLDVIKNKIFRILLLLVLFFELIPFAKSFMVLSPVPQLGYDTELLPIISSDTTGKRLHQNFAYTQRLGRAIDFNAPAMLPLFATNGNWPFIMRNYGEFYLSMDGETDESLLLSLKQLPPLAAANPTLLNFLSIRYILSTGDFRPVDNPSLHLVLDNPYRWFTLYENIDAYPRYFPVYQAEYFPNREDMKNSLSKNEYNLSKTVLFTGNKKQQVETCQNTEAGSITVGESTVNDVHLDVSLPCDGYIVSSDVMYSGWVAYVDGKRVDILIANLAFRTVFVPKGNHTVTYRFIPLTVIAGNVISLVTFVCIGIVYFRKRKHI